MEILYKTIKKSNALELSTTSMYRWLPYARTGQPERHPFSFGDFGTVLPGSRHSFEHRKFALSSSPTERIEFRVGVGKESSRAIEFHYAPCFKKHNLTEAISTETTPVNDSSVTNPVVIDDSAKTMRNGQNRALGEFTDGGVRHIVTNGLEL
jgi:hypothetical protein